MNHSYGSLPPEQQENMRRFAKQVYEEVTGQGFYEIAAAPAAVAELVNRQLLDSLSEILDYQGGADNALADNYVVERARAAIAAAESQLNKVPAPFDEVTRLNAERYLKLRDTKALRIDYYGEELDRYLDEQPLWDQRASHSILGGLKKTPPAQLAPTPEQIEHIKRLADEYAIAQGHVEIVSAYERRKARAERKKARDALHAALDALAKGKA